MKDSAKNPQISPQQLKQMLGTPEMQQLLKLLNRDGGKSLQQAAQQFRTGDITAAQETIKPLMQNEEASTLLQKLNNQQKGK